MTVCIIAQLEYELVYYDSTVHRFNYYTMKTPPCENYYFIPCNWV